MKLYVDGSWKTGTPDYAGWGYALIQKEKIIHEDSGFIEQHSRQIDGELFATLAGIEYCKGIGLSSIELVFDYIGIEKWAKGDWKAKSLVAKEYVKRMKDFKDIKIKYTKVKSHIGEDPWNDYVDKLAKDALNDAQ